MNLQNQVWHTQPAAVLATLQVTPDGLTPAQVDERQQRFGRNELPTNQSTERGNDDNTGRIASLHHRPYDRWGLRRVGALFSN